MEGSFETLFRVKRTQIEMMRDRGYDTFLDEINFFFEDDEPVKFDQYKFASRYPTMQSLSQNYHHPLTQRNAYVHFFEKRGKKDKVSSEQIKDLSLILARKLDQNFDTIVLISDVIIDKEGNDTLLNYPIFNFQTFLYEDLIENKTHHVLVPKHILLPFEDTKNVLIINRLKRDQLKKLAYDDPIVKYYGGIPGQIFKIIRSKPNVPVMFDESIDYRVVTYDSIRQLLK